jgi:uncharacterized membrane protein
MPHKHLDLLRHRREIFGVANNRSWVNQVHHDSLSLNDKIARFISRRVGTMWFCYGLAAIMFIWGIINILLGKRAFDAYPFSFLFFCLGGIMQSLLMPLIMVAQNLDTRHAELRAESDHLINQENVARLERIEQSIKTLIEQSQKQPRKRVKAESEGIA